MKTQTETKLKIENYLLIIGAMKCGTTSLFNILAQHPEISACSYKEPQFFAHQKNYSRGLDYYQSLWKWDSNQHKVAMEASTSYTKVHATELNSAKNIALLKDKANFKFIYVLRNPIDRVESQCRHQLAKGYTSSSSLRKSIISDKIIDTSKYAQQIEEYYKRFDSEDILLVDFDDLKSASSEWLQSICSFLEIDSDYRFSELQNVYHDSKRKNLEFNWRKHDIPLKKKLINLSGKVPFKYKKMAREIFGKKNGYFQLSIEQKEYVACKLQNDIQTLKDKYGFNTDKWNLN